MTTLEMFTVIALILGPVSGIVVAVVVDRRSKRGQEQNTDVALRTVRVDEREAHNHEVAIIIDGFTASLSNMRADLDRAVSESRGLKDELRGQSAEILELREKIDKAEALAAVQAGHISELVSHITDLEALVPNPPGPPTRPQWVLHLPPSRN